MIIKLELQVMFQRTNVGLTLLNTFFLELFLNGTKYIPDIKDVSITVLKKHLLKEIQSDPHPVYKIYKSIGLKVPTRLRLGLSHQYRFNHNFENCLSPLSTCILEAETTSHFFLRSINIILSELHCLMNFAKLI